MRESWILSKEMGFERLREAAVRERAGCVYGSETFSVFVKELGEEMLRSVLTG